MYGSSNTQRIGYRIHELRNATGLGRSKIYQLISEGELDVVRIGRCTLITAESVDALLEKYRSKDTNHSRRLSPLLTIEQVAEFLGCGIKRIQNLQKAGSFPPPTRINNRLIGWRENEIEAWLSSNNMEGSDV